MWVHQSTTTGVLVALLSGLGAGCGGSDEALGPTVATVPAEQRTVVEGGAITVRGDVAPGEHGPFALRGRYRASFVQRGAGVDFTAEVPFTSLLETAVASGPAERVPLFEDAARTGTATVSVPPGRYRVVVDFGDSPYELRLTPAR